MKEFFVAFAFLALVLFAAAVFEVPSESFYKAGIEVLCTGDICQ